MRYLTRAAIGPFSTDRGYAKAHASYAAQLRLCRAEMGPEMHTLAETISFHDGLIESIRSEGSDLLMTCVAGDLQHGYRKLSICYENGKVGKARECARILRDRRSEILAAEFHRASAGIWEHNFLIAPRGEISITFTTLEVTTERLPFRHLDYFGDPYLVGEE